MDEDYSWFDAYYGTPADTENNYVPQDTEGFNADGSPATQDGADSVDAAAPDENAPENWIDYGNGLAANVVTGEVQDDQGNTVAWLTDDPLVEDGSGLQQRDPNDPGTSDYLPPTDVATGPGFFGSLFGGIGDFLGGLLGGNADGRAPGSSGSSGGGSMGGGGSSSGSQQQQALQKAQQQLTAAQGANANPNVIAALQAQIRALQGGGSSSTMQTVLLLGAIAGAVYLVTRNNRAA